MHSLPLELQAIHKVDDVKKVLKAYCHNLGVGRPGESQMVEELLVRHMKGFSADGEAAEQLTPKFLKESGTFPELVLMLRCYMHRLQREMENALTSDGLIKSLLDEFVRRFSDPKDKTNPGGFARALRNCDDLRRQFMEAVGQCVKEIDSLLAGLNCVHVSKHDVSQAAQRFDSILDALRMIVVNIRAVVQFLVQGSLLVNFSFRVS